MSSHTVPPDKTLTMANGSPTHSRTFSVDEVGFFEGPEKLLEVWFDLATSTGAGGLRLICKKDWEELLRLVNCEIMSQCSNSVMDAYLLSESSLFVSDNRFVLKTCGSTTLLHAVRPLLKLVGGKFPNHQVTAFFYSHRNFQKPHLQLHPHTSFEDEAEFLDRIFPEGAAYALGRINRSAWYLYTSFLPSHYIQSSDQTLEIMMTDLEPEVMSLYSQLSYSDPVLLMNDTGIDRIMPGAILDARIFEPCGFSVNAIIKDDAYFTIHVTPQLECAYVSFETNLVLSSHAGLIAKVLSIFRPGTVTLSLFISKGSSFEPLPHPLLGEEQVTEYRYLDKQFCSFPSYDLTFCHLARTAPSS